MVEVSGQRSTKVLSLGDQVTITVPVSITGFDHVPVPVTIATITLVSTDD